MRLITDADAELLRRIAGKAIEFRIDEGMRPGVWYVMADGEEGEGIGDAARVLIICRPGDAPELTLAVASAQESA